MDNMKLILLTLCAAGLVTTYAANHAPGNTKTNPIADQPLTLEEPLPPILPISDIHGHLIPSLGEQTKNKEPIIGRPDGHENHGEQNLLGLQDGHEDHRDTLLGRPDGHENDNEQNLLGVQDGHEDRRDTPLIGAPDGHDDHHEKQPLLGAPDGHDGFTGHPLIGKPDGHDDWLEEDEDNVEPIGDDYQERNTNDDAYYYGANNEEPQPIGDSDEDEPLVRCRRPMCLMFCDHGFQTDNTGCPICQCLDDPCQGITCEEGLTCRAKGCDHGKACVALTHECARAPCAIPMCMDHCEHGYKNDKRGCMTCDCYESESIEPSSLSSHECPEIECLTTCSKGYKFDEEGCMTCDCVGKICSRPLCTTDCAGKGYKSDADGCLTCDCNDSTKSSEVKEKFVCATPMCMTRCDNGYKHNAQGCMTCDCNEALAPPTDVKERYPCATPMCMTQCSAGYKNNANGCMTCDCNEPLLSEVKEVPCATPMCMTRCDNGYKNNARGCMTCECDAPLCGEKHCDVGQICQNRTVKYQDTQICIPKPLCHTMREKSGVGRSSSTGGLGQFAPECESNGAYKPMQCDKRQGDCWCVDDAGTEVDGSRTVVYTEKHKPDCKRNITVQLTVRLSLMLSMDDHINYGGSLTGEQLKNDLREHASSWLMIQEEFITVSKVNKVTGQPTETYNIVILARRDDTWCDLASAADHMRRKFNRENVNVPVNQVTFTPVPQSLEISHQFSHPAQTPNFHHMEEAIMHSSDDWQSYCVNHSYLVISAGCVMILFLLTLLLLFVKIMRRRQSRTGAMNFRHQPLESQISTSSEKCLLKGMDDSSVVLLSAEPINEKVALA